MIVRTLPAGWSAVAHVLLAALALPLTGCATTRLEVVDATSGVAIPEAEILIQDRPHPDIATRTDGQGRAGIPATADGATLLVTAPGFQRYEMAWPNPAPSRQRVALQPSWVAEFLHEGAEPSTAPDAEIYVPHHCPVCP